MYVTQNAYTLMYVILHALLHRLYYVVIVVHDRLCTFLYDCMLGDP